MTNLYRVEDLAFVVPTKDRPVQIANLLESLACQTQRCARVVVVDGGKSIDHVIESFRGRLAIDYVCCPVPGQIKQRNMGIGMLGTKYKLVGFLDDDLVLEPDALGRMIEYWNQVEGDAAGVGFNIVNVPPFRHSRILGLLFMSSKKPGSILKSGYNVSVGNILTNARTQWLGGGYTVWRSDILKQFPQDSLNTRWAIGEDLRFSYPIGKQYPLYVCACARVRHEHVYDQAPAGKVHLYRGRKSAISQFYFVQLHEKDFSRIACLWMLLWKSIFRLANACARGRRNELFQALGEMSGWGICVHAAFASRLLRSELEDQPESVSR